MAADTPEYRSARRAYERGRLRSSARQALLIVAAVAAFGAATYGPRALTFLPLTLATWVFAYWRGHLVLRGAFYGLVGGLVTSVLPMSILRPCCAGVMEPGADCCTMPGVCVAAGALVGVVLSAFVPYGKSSWWRTALGVALGMTSVVVVKCATLVAGEAFGLVGGLVGGLVATAAARAGFGRRLST